MRVIKLIARSALILAVIAVVGLLIAREVLLFMAVSRVKSSLSVLRSTAIKRDYFQLCQDQGAEYIEGDQYASLQLRFLSSRDYVVEILCTQHSLNPIVLETQSLPPFVQKTAGSSGVIWGDEKSAVALEIYGRTSAVGFEDNKVATFPDATQLGTGPISICKSYGFSCCQTESQVGLGQQLTGVTDCPKSCYRQCDTRPVVLSFRTQPLVDDKTHQLVVTPGRSIDFAYIVDLGTAVAGTVKLDYGDGTVEQFTSVEGTTEHQYQCQANQCLFTARLTVTDDRGITNADLPISSINIMVQ